MNTDEGFEDDLRHRFDVALDGVQPPPDLYGRVEARVSRRNSARLVAGIAAVALVLAGGVLAVNAVGPSSDRLRVDPIASPPSEGEPTDPPGDDLVDASEEPTAEPTDQPTDQPDASEAPTLEGDPYTGPPIIEGAELAVIGVDADDVLNVRAAPGADHDVVATLDPLADGFTATGQGRSLDRAVWVEVDTGDVTGWVHAAFVAHTAGTDDITSQIIDEHGSRPSAGTLAELAEIIASHRVTQDPPSRVVISDGPRVGDFGEVTVDVVGFGDDAVRAARLVIFARVDDGGASFTLHSVEATTYCGRGVDDGELCV